MFNFVVCKGFHMQTFISHLPAEKQERYEGMTRYQIDAPDRKGISEAVLVPTKAYWVSLEDELGWKETPSVVVHKDEHTLAKYAWRVASFDLGSNLPRTESATRGEAVDAAIHFLQDIGEQAFWKGFRKMKAEMEKVGMSVNGSTEEPKPKTKAKSVLSFTASQIPLL